jgi:type I restriction enzyme R subunit
MREGYEEVEDEPTDEVVKFWNKMMKRYGNEDDYNKNIINQFKFGDDPEILIVVSKLLTGFDAPRNTVLYLTTTLREHNLLQAIARVNRLYEKKDYGYIIDYANVLGELDKALTMYDLFKEFDDEDLIGTVASIKDEIEKIPQKHSDLWDVFKSIKNVYDEEEYEKLLSDEELRDKFYERLLEYGKTLSIALSSDDFLLSFDEDKLKQYKNDLKKFENLRRSVKYRYAESVSYKEYEPKIKKLLDTHILANEVRKLNDPVNIFDDNLFQGVKEEQGVYEANTPSKADSIAYATKKVIMEKMEEDPAFYQRFSILIQQAIDDWNSKRLSDIEYLRTVLNIRKKVVTKQHDDVPKKLETNDEAMAYFGVIKPILQTDNLDKDKLENICSEISLAIQEIINKNHKVNFWQDEDAQNRTKNDIDDYLFDEIKGESKFDISPEQMDNIIEKTLAIAKFRRSK